MPRGGGLPAEARRERRVVRSLYVRGKERLTRLCDSLAERHSSGTEANMQLHQIIPWVPAGPQPVKKRQEKPRKSFFTLDEADQAPPVPEPEPATAAPRRSRGADLLADPEHPRIDIEV